MTEWQLEWHRDRVPVRWRIRYERQSLGQWSAPKEAVCVNISGHGMLLLLNDMLENDEILRLHMRDVNHDSSYTLAQVRWSKPGSLEPNGTMMAGVEYVEIDDVD